MWFVKIDSVVMLVVLAIRMLVVGVVYFVVGSSSPTTPADRPEPPLKTHRFQGGHPVRRQPAVPVFSPNVEDPFSKSGGCVASTKLRHVAVTVARPKGPEMVQSLVKGHLIAARRLPIKFQLIHGLDAVGRQDRLVAVLELRKGTPLGPHPIGQTRIRVVVRVPTHIGVPEFGLESFQLVVFLMPFQIVLVEWYGTCCCRRIIIRGGVGSAIVSQGIQVQGLNESGILVKHGLTFLPADLGIRVLVLFLLDPLLEPGHVRFGALFLFL